MHGYKIWSGLHDALIYNPLCPPLLQVLISIICIALEVTTMCLMERYNLPHILLRCHGDNVVLLATETGTKDVR